MEILSDEEEESMDEIDGDVEDAVTESDDDYEDAEEERNAVVQMPLHENVVATSAGISTISYRKNHVNFFWSHCFLSITFSFILSSTNAQRVERSLFPLRGAVFLPHDKRIQAEYEEKGEHYLATIESVMPIIDVAISDAGKKYLKKWLKPKTADKWLQIHEAPIRECEDQKRAAWAALEALQWTNGSGLDVGFGPACDYVLATVTRILSFHSVPMFTNAGFSEFFNIKDDSLLTRVGPLQDHITNFVHKLAVQFNWKRPQLLYQKSFWESELREAGFCKLLMQGMYVWTVEKKWDLQVNPRIVGSFWDSDNPREFFKSYMIDTIGTNYGATPLKIDILIDIMISRTSPSGKKLPFFVDIWGKFMKNGAFFVFTINSESLLLFEKIVYEVGDF